MDIYEYFEIVKDYFSFVAENWIHVIHGQEL